MRGGCACYNALREYLELTLHVPPDYAYARGRSQARLQGKGNPFRQLISREGGPTLAAIQRTPAGVNKLVILQARNSVVVFPS